MKLFDGDWFSAKAWLFDLDGVLVDSTESVERHWRAFAEWIDIDGDDLLTRIHGVPHAVTITRECKGRPQHEVAALIDRFQQLEEQDATSETALPGALELVSQLPPDKWGVVTSCWQNLAKARAAAAGIPLPETLVTIDQIERGKPAPDGYLEGARRLGVDAKECAVFEDAPSGIAAAVAAGAFTVAVRTTTPDAQLREALDDQGIVVDDLRNIEALIKDDRLIVRTKTAK